MKKAAFVILLGVLSVPALATVPKQKPGVKKLDLKIVKAEPVVKARNEGKTINVDANVKVDGKAALFDAKHFSQYTLSNGQTVKVRSDLLSDFGRFLTSPDENIYIGDAKFSVTKASKTFDQIAVEFLNEALKVKPANIDDGVFLEHVFASLAVLQQSVKQDVVVAVAGGLLQDYKPDPKLGSTKLTYNLSIKGIDVYQESYGKENVPGKKVLDSYRIILTFRSAAFAQMNAEIKIAKL